MTKQEKVAAASACKEKGNAAFKAGDYEEALEQYKEGVASFDLFLQSANVILISLFCGSALAAIINCSLASLYDAISINAAPYRK
mmetsp:Transcript_11798/g.10085  ORF Transcript_11798/g.10085 Transcript_11798/m.10085 type:complete len:85 (-) Transcript_11798:132-386(-)